MHLRRVLLLISMVLLLTAGVIAVSSPRRDTRTSPGLRVPPAPARTAAPRNVSLTFPPPRRAAVVRLVQGDHALVEVRATQPGEAAVMGLTGTAEPGTPATFDVLAGAPGRYPVTFRPTLATRARQIATVQVAP